jgi:hypothetical protein
VRLRLGQIAKQHHVGRSVSLPRKTARKTGHAVGKAIPEGIPLPVRSRIVNKRDSESGVRHGCGSRE